MGPLPDRGPRRLKYQRPNDVKIDAQRQTDVAGAVNPESNQLFRGIYETGKPR